MSVFICKFMFVNFYKLKFPLTYNPEIGRKVSVGEFDSYKTGFFTHCSNKHVKNKSFDNAMYQMKPKQVHV